MKPDYSSFRWFLPEIRRWSRRRKWRHPFAGLAFFRRTSDPTVTDLVSRHWPHLMCWSWGLSWHRQKGDERYGWRPIRLGNSILVWRLRLSWQDYDWMVAPQHEAEVSAIIAAQQRKLSAAA